MGRLPLPGSRVAGRSTSYEDGTTLTAGQVRAPPRRSIREAQQCRLSAGGLRCGRVGMNGGTYVGVGVE